MICYVFKEVIFTILWNARGHPRPLAFLVSSQSSKARGCHLGSSSKDDAPIFLCTPAPAPPHTHTYNPLKQSTKMMKPYQMMIWMQMRGIVENKWLRRQFFQHWRWKDGMINANLIIIYWKLTQVPSYLRAYDELVFIDVLSHIVPCCACLSILP